jgi:hypothetical protein
MVQGVIGEAARNPRLAEILRRTVFSSGREGVRRIIERAVERGEIAPPDDSNIAVSLIAGPLFYRLLVTGEPITARTVDHLVPLLLGALGARTD